MSLNPLQKDTSLQAESTLVQQSPVYLFACTKAERLVTAVHLMTRHIGESEPLRTSLRRESVSLLKLIHAHDTRRSEDALLERIALLKSLLDAAFHTGLIGRLNHTVVEREFDSLATFIRERGGVFGSTETVVGDTFFAVPEPHAIPVKKQQVERPAAGRPASTIKDTISKGQNRIPAVAHRPRQRVAEKKNTRREAILELLKRQQNVSVRDVARVVSNVSEKTLQRELLALVDEGVIKKEGERRWSTYSLI